MKQKNTNYIKFFLSKISFLFYVATFSGNDFEILISKNFMDFLFPRGAPLLWVSYTVCNQGQ